MKQSFKHNFEALCFHLFLGHNCIDNGTNLLIYSNPNNLDLLSFGNSLEPFSGYLVGAYYSGTQNDPANWEKERKAETFVGISYSTSSAAPSLLILLPFHPPMSSPFLKNSSLHPQPHISLQTIKISHTPYLPQT